MGSNLLFGSAIYLLIFVSAVMCGRFPLGIYRNGDSDDTFDDGVAGVFGMTKMKVLDWSDDHDDVGDEDYNYNDSQEEIDLENYFKTDDGTTAYVTDVQIKQLQNSRNTQRQDQEAYTVDPRCPAFNGICSAQVCSSDNGCGKQICCYNGCVHTCVEIESTISPVEVNWMPYDSGNSIVLQESSVSNTETITIPGGCKVSQKQRTGLDLFFKYGHVTKCVCMKDDVVCYVRRRDAFTIQQDPLQQ